MADGFGFRVEDAQPVAAETALREVHPMVAAGTGAGAPESWWGELAEFAAPLALCVGFAAAVIAFAPGGLSVLVGGPLA